MDAQDNLHPSVRAFKAFVSAHPGVISEVQEGKKSMQNLYEEWTILGENHEHWQAYRHVEGAQREMNETTEAEQVQAEEAPEASEGGGELMGQLLAMMKKMNVQDLQSHLAQFSTVLGNIQNLVQTFQKPPEEPVRKENDSPFSFRKD